MKNMLSLAAGITLLAGVSAANAFEPVSLTTAQMDQVTAGSAQVDNSSLSQRIKQRVKNTTTQTNTINAAGGDGGNSSGSGKAGDGGSVTLSGVSQSNSSTNTNTLTASNSVKK